MSKLPLRSSLAVIKTVMKNISHLRMRNVSGTPISIIPIPFNEKVRSTRDTGHAPAYLEKHGLSRALTSLGFSVNAHPAITHGEMARMVSSTRSAVGSRLRHREKCIALGGTHAVALGTIGGALDVFGSELGVIWIDAHGDLNTHKTSPTGDVSGMVLAALLGVGERSLTDLVPKKLRAKNLLHIGLKDADSGEIALVERRGLTVVTIANIAAGGLVDCAKHTRGLARRAKQVWVSLDVDSIDENDAPASPMASRGGLTYRDVTNLMRHIGNTCNVVGLDIVEIAPKKDVRGKTARLCIELAASAFGAVHNWYKAEYLPHSRLSA